MTKNMTHPDGSECLEGKKSKTTKGYKPCCDSFKHRLTKCVYDLRFGWFSGKKSGKHWGIVLQDGSYIQIKYCPFCGEPLTGTSKYVGLPVYDCYDDHDEVEWVTADDGDGMFHHIGGHSWRIPDEEAKQLVEGKDGLLIQKEQV